MKKSLKFSGLGLVILTISMMLTIRPVTPTNPQSKTVPTTHKEVMMPLTSAELKRKPSLLICSIIYYAINHLRIQRWQEVADVKRGWQVDIYPHGATTQYLVWPDKKIKAAAKTLEPNWFELTTTDHIKFHSYTVHSFQKAMTATTTLDQVVSQLNSERAANRVRHLQNQLILNTPRQAGN
ncbi:hypothetical protein C5Z26_01060 [Lactobacillus sp. CBA3606]|uniref:hypothetical protein n=1 Tax=Lactobacillus sp. CBA3606 TaxID=2099789 RepID=UPI000CFDBCFA|nr:hypothetical protein [Lactobacillus sp. CBA3606]AVK62797.1 hypothetical protein C5Z26_01060 [Lactobacillus sp. CBA3606]